VKYIILITGTVFIIVVSWFLSIRYKRYHGIARFFAFESIFVLVLLNLKIWFRNPFSLLQIISWILLILSAYTVVAGFLLLSKKGKPDSNFENTSLLVKSGIYKLIRHPLYLSLLLLGTGIMLKNPEPLQIALGLINLIAVWITARIEEKEMIAKFGEVYKEYIKDTRMFIPFLL
jgi:protein-S-isoprenylcysteine O-methyltransferase Ste14